MTTILAKADRGSSRSGGRPTGARVDATRMSHLRQAFGRLREARSVEQLRRKAVVEPCRSFGFDCAVLFSVRGAALVAESAHFEGDTESAEEFLRLAQSKRSDREPSRAAAEIVPTGPTAYVAAPIISEGEVVGILHADCRFSERPLGLHDRDTLWAFAEGVGYLLERAALRERLDTQRGSFSNLISAASKLEAELTPREHEVLALMGAGATNAEIASRLVISENTVKSHVKHVLCKLGAGNRAEAVSLYLLDQRGLGSDSNRSAPRVR